MSGTGVYEGADWSIWNKVRANVDCKGVWIVKSGCIELWLHRCTSEFNAILSWCGVKSTAHRFFDSKPDLTLEVLSVMVVEQPLAVGDVALEQSFATCLPLLQKRHRFWLKQCWHSCWVSLPSFLSFEERLEFIFSGWNCQSWHFRWCLKYWSCQSFFYCCCFYPCWNSDWCCSHWCPCLCHSSTQALERLEFLWPLQSGVPNNEN